MPHLYLAPWRWVDDPTDMSGWVAPSPFTVGTLDLPSIPQMSVAGGVPRGVGLFALTQRDPNVRGLYLGDDLALSLRTPMKRGIEQALRVSLSNQRLLDILWELFTAHADPTGQVRWKPLMPTVQGNMELWLGGYSRVHSERYDPQAHPLVMEVVRRDFQRNRIELARRGQLDHHRRVLGALLQKYGRFGVRAEDIAPGVEPLAPSTTITDDFNRADESLDAGSWVEVDANFSVVSNEISRTGTDGSGFPGLAHHTTDLSSADHYAEIVFKTQQNNFAFMGGAARASGTSNSDENAYFGIVRAQGSLRTISKTVNGTNTNISTDSGGSGPPQTVRAEANGSTIKMFDDGVEIFSVTDTDITGTLTAGIAVHYQDEATGDDFEAADLAAAAARRRVGFGAGYAIRL